MGNCSSLRNFFSRLACFFIFFHENFHGVSIVCFHGRREGGQEDLCARCSALMVPLQVTIYVQNVAMPSFSLFYSIELIHGITL